MKFIFSLFFFLLLSFQIFSGEIIKDDILEKKIEKAYSDIYAFHFNDAIVQINEMKKDYSSSPWPYIIASNYHWWMYVAGENTEKTIKLYYYNVEMAQERISSNKTHSNVFCQLAVFSYLSRFEMMQKDYFSVLSRMKTYLNELLFSLGKEEEYKPYSLTSGLYYYLTQSLYDDYILLRPLLMLFPEGDKKKGLRLLKETSYSENDLLANEANYFLAKIYADSEKNYYSALYYTNSLIQKFPDNFIFLYYYKNYRSKISKEEYKWEVQYEIEKYNNSQLTEKQNKYNDFLYHSF